MTDIIIKQEKHLWVPLHVHSEYSALDGAIRIPKYYDFALKHALPAAAVTDHFVMSSFVEMDKTFKDVKPIFGCETYSGSILTGGPAVPFKGRRRYHFNTFALSKKGLINLQKLAAAGYCADNEEASGPYAVTRDGLEQYHEDIAFGSACLSGELPVLLANDMNDKAEEWLDTVCGIVGKDNFYIELIDIAYPEQDKMNIKLIDFARKHNIKTIVTTDSHYMQEDVSWYNALLAAQKKQTMVETETENDAEIAERFNSWDITGQMDLSLRTPDQIWDKWKNICPEAVEETVRLAERAERYTLKGSKYMLPHMSSSEDGFRDKARMGLERRLETSGIDTRPKSSEYKDYHNRLERELDVVEGMGFVDYFTLVEDLVRSCKEKGIKIGPGRGSAAGSMLAWSLGITELDPKKFGLLFERFLNPERVSMPDIDIDFEDERRGEAIAYLKSRYGDSAVVPISNYSRCKWKNGIRDAARVLGAQPWQGDELVKSLEGVIDTSFMADDDMEEFTPDENVTTDTLLRFLSSRSTSVAEMPTNKVTEIIELAGHFNGMLRNYGKHASGIVISPGRADDYVPLGRVKGSIATQYNMDDVDYVKLVKVDILGLSTLSMIKEIEEEASKIEIQSCKTPKMADFIRFINMFGGCRAEDSCDTCFTQETGIDAESVKKTFELFSSGNTTGVFQFASGGMRNLLRKIRPQTIEDLSSAVALFRPGPLGSGITESYVAAGKKKKVNDNEKKTFPDSMKQKIDIIASDTRGMIIYQEHIMKVAQEIAGYTLGEADILRKAIGKKKKEIMEVERVKFIKKCTECADRYSEADAAMAFDTIEYFAGYGFNKSHSFCYALLAFITAWYAANRAPVFWAALINDTVKKQRKDLKGQNKISPLLREARKRIHSVYPPMLASDFDSTSAEQMRKTRALFYPISSTDNQDPSIWYDIRNWGLLLGLSVTKGMGKTDKHMERLLSLGAEQDDTLQDIIYKCVKSGDKTGIAAAGPLFLNGFFDRVLVNTMRANNYDLKPIYMRLSILDMADPYGMDENIKTVLFDACKHLTDKDKELKIKSNGLPFDITKSRSVWGSFLDHVVEKLIANAHGKKKKDKDAILSESLLCADMSFTNNWIFNYFEPLIAAMVKKGQAIKNLMSTDPNMRLHYMLQIYRIEKNDFGESITVTDWAMASEMSGWTFQMYSDEAVSYRQEKLDQKYKAKKLESDYLFDEDAISQMSAKGGVWILGQFINASWKGQYGTITMEGRNGQADRMLYINTKQRLPFINIDAMKKVSAHGGYIAVRAIFNKDKMSFDMVDSEKVADEIVNGGFTKLTDSIVIFPLLSVKRTKTDGVATECEPGIIKLKTGDTVTGRFVETRNGVGRKEINPDIKRCIFFKDTIWGVNNSAVRILTKEDGWSFKDL